MEFGSDHIRMHVNDGPNTHPIAVRPPSLPGINSRRRRRRRRRCWPSTASPGHPKPPPPSSPTSPPPLPHPTPTSASSNPAFPDHSVFPAPPAAAGSPRSTTPPDRRRRRAGRSGSASRLRISPPSLLPSPFPWRSGGLWLSRGSYLPCPCTLPSTLGTGLSPKRFSLFFFFLNCDDECIRVLLLLRCH